MDTVLVETGKEAVTPVVFDGGLLLLLSSLSYLFALGILIGAIVISLRWIIKRTPDRDPTPFSVVTLLQLLFFILFNAVLGTPSMTTSGAPDKGMWYLVLAQTIGPVVGDLLLCVFSVALVSLTARRLPVLPAGAILPLVIVLLDVALRLMWTTHMLFMRL